MFFPTPVFALPSTRRHDTFVRNLLNLMKVFGKFTACTREIYYWSKVRLGTLASLPVSSLDPKVQGLLSTREIAITARYDVRRRVRDEREDRIVFFGRLFYLPSTYL